MLRFLIVSSLMTYACQSSQDSNLDSYEAMVQGTISYPFYLDTDPIGQNGNQHKFVIKTISGGTEYIVEIPEAAADYEVTVPLASLDKGDSSQNRDIENARNVQLTDRELVGQFPKLDAATEEERILLDKAFGVSEEGGPRQAPSYTIGLAKLNQLYRKTDYELALVEVNNLLAFYPTSSRLYKMKGSILIKLGNLRLAEKSWIRASELAPDDPVVQRGITNLRQRIRERQVMASQQKTAKNDDERK